MKTKVLLIFWSISWDHAHSIKTGKKSWSQERDRNIRNTFVFVFHHSFQHDKVSGYSFYKRTTEWPCYMHLLSSCVHRLESIFIYAKWVKQNNFWINKGAFFQGKIFCIQAAE